MGYISTWMGDRLSSRPGRGVSDSEFVLLPDFHKFWFATDVSNDITAHRCRAKDSLALLELYFIYNRS